MKLGLIGTIAKSQGINLGKCSKIDLIKSIQMDEGNFDCYGSAYIGKCDQSECLWREDCFDASK